MKLRTAFVRGHFARSTQRRALLWLTVAICFPYCLSAIGEEGDNTAWANWHSSAESMATGSIGDVNIEFEGDIEWSQLGGDRTNYWALGSDTYTSPGVVNNPPTIRTDQITLHGGRENPTTQRLSFSQPVTDPVMAILSLGSFRANPATFDFADDFNILNSGRGHFGMGPFEKQPGNVLFAQEGHGLIQFKGVFESLEWTNPVHEEWYAFQVGIPTNVTEFEGGAVQTFNGGDSGEGLDLDGTFAHAIDFGGPGGVTVGDATFTDGSESGISENIHITATQEVRNWHRPEYGSTANDDGLELVMESIRWNGLPGFEVDVPIESGSEYKLQLLFAEGCCNRGFDVLIEEDSLVNDFNVQVAQGGINNPEQGVVVSHTFTALDDVLSLVLRGDDPNTNDDNPIISALTLEVLSDQPANPGMPPVSLPLDCNSDGAVDNGDLMCANASQILDELLEALSLPLGDIDGNGEVGFTDFLVLSESFGKPRGEYTQGDLDGDGRVDFPDFLILAENFGSTTASVATVPEPNTGILCFFAFLGLRLLSNRRRR